MVWYSTNRGVVIECGYQGEDALLHSAILQLHCGQYVLARL